MFFLVSGQIGQINIAKIIFKLFFQISVFMGIKLLFTYIILPSTAYSDTILFNQ